MTRIFSLSLLLTSALSAQVRDQIVRPINDGTNLIAADSPLPDLASVNGLNRGAVAISPVEESGTANFSYSFGQNFSTYNTPYQNESASFANDVLFEGREGLREDGTYGRIDPVYPKLYPTGFGTPAGVTISAAELQDPATGGAFRYRWLMYGPDPDHVDGEDNDGDGDIDQTPAILNLFGSQSSETNAWFTDADREMALSQIAVLRGALSLDPLNRELQSALLDIYFDLGVAEMQLVRRQLVLLGRLRLGLDTPTPFIIDTEIEIYEKMVARTGQVLELYGELFSLSMAGFQPSDLFLQSIAERGTDPSRGSTLGYFIFQNQVPLRKQVVSQFLNADTSVVTNIVGPGEQNIFQGFKDYRSLLTIMGQYIQFQADLARLRGMRRAVSTDGDDIELAREGLLQAQETIGLASVLENMFAHIDFDDPEFDDTGVRAAREAVSVATNSTTNVRNFLNGIANVLGLDPNFLLLVPPQPSLVINLDDNNQGNSFDSYDVLAFRLTEKSGDTNIGPLAIAKNLLGDPTNPLTGGGAIQAYSTFRESVDRVTMELSDLEDEYAERFVQITGYDYESEAGDWDGMTPKPGAVSELQSANEAILSLKRQQEKLSSLGAAFLTDVGETQEAVSIASGIAGTITGAQAAYLDSTSSAWTELHVQAGLAAGAQAVADGALTAVTLENPLSAGAKLGVIAGVTAVNGAAQTVAAVRTSMREQELEKAAIAFETTLATAELPLTVQESRLALSELQREVISNKIEIEDNNAAIFQAIAERDTLLAEVARAESNLRADRASLAKRFYADPIHFIRSENAILEADASFRNAQRWTYFTCRALEHKWQERFKFADEGDVTLGVSFDVNSIFSARNALELERVLQKMAQFNLARISAATVTGRTIISFRDHLLSPNPADPNRTFSTLIEDNGLRNRSGGLPVDQLTDFRRQLRSYNTRAGDPGASDEDLAQGNFTIPFDTTRLSGLGGGFFQGPNFSDLSNPESGVYRNKIVWIAVNLVAEDGVTPPQNNGRSGRIVYGGNTYYRTRVPVCPNREVGDATGTPFDRTTDFSSEFLIRPFRFFQDTQFDGQFEVFDRQNVGSMKFSYSGDSANNPTVLNAILGSELSQAGFRRGDLQERSVAATRWDLQLNQIDINQLLDIELIIEHVYTPRPQISCPPTN